MRVSSVHQARRRALWAWGAMIVGILIGYRFAGIDPLVWWSLACGVLGGAILIGGRWKSALFVLGILGLGAGLVGLRTDQTPADRLDRLVGSSQDSSVPIEIRGVLIDPIETQITPTSPGEPPMWTTRQTRTRIAIDEVYMRDAHGRGSWVDASGIAKLMLPDDRQVDASAPDLASDPVLGPGDRIEALGMFTPAGSARNLGDLDWKAINAQSGRVGTMVITDWSMLRPIGHTGLIARAKAMVLGWQGALRVRALGALGLGVDGLSEDELDQDSFEKDNRHRSVLGALLLGQRDPSFDQVYETFQRVGVAHVLAISGFHLALVIMLGVLAIRLIGEHPRIETAIIITILLLGALVIPMRPPIVRAGVIVVVLMISGRLGRRYDRLTVLAWVGVGLLIWRPMDVFSLGYQLSMGITGLLVMLSHRETGENMAVLNRSTLTTAKMKAGRGMLGKLRVGVFETTKANFACWAAAMPAIAYHAGIVSVLAPLVSLMLVPMVVVLMVLGYGQIAIGVLSPALASKTIGIVDSSSRVVTRFIGWVDTLEWSWIPVGSIGWVWTIGATAWIVATITRKWKALHPSAILAGVALIVWAIGIGAMPSPDRFRIDMLDVGDGTGVLIQSNGQGLIWDCGSLDHRVGKSMRSTARAAGLGRIADAIVTHDNIDHFNGLLDLADDLELERVWVTRRMLDDPSPSWEATEDRLGSMGVKIRELGAGTRITLGDVELECLWPDPALIDSMTQNNTSAVMRIEVPIDKQMTRTVLLTGDIERQAMDMILRTHPELRADIIELPHHGSTKPGALAFVRSLDPLVVLQSTGLRRLNDPYWDTLRAGRFWYATAEQGGAWARIMPDGRIEHGWARGTKKSQND